MHLPLPEKQSRKAPAAKEKKGYVQRLVKAGNNVSSEAEKTEERPKKNENAVVVEKRRRTTKGTKEGIKGMQIAKNESCSCLIFLLATQQYWKEIEGQEKRLLHSALLLMPLERKVPISRDLLVQAPPRPSLLLLCATPPSPPWKQK